MKKLIKRAYAEQASKLATAATPAAVVTTPAKAAAPARSWAQRDYPVPASQRKPKANARNSMHFKILSRTK